MQSPTHGPFRAGFWISTKNLRNSHVGSFPAPKSLPKTPENFPALWQAAAVIAEPGAAGPPAELAPSGAFLGTTHPASGPGQGHTPGWAAEGGAPVATPRVLPMAG